MVTEHSPYRVLVEGRDDKYAIIGLMTRHGVDWDSAKGLLPYVDDCGGIDVVVETLGVAAKSGYPRLGVVVDANTDTANRWEQVRTAFTKADVNLPKSPVREGTIMPGMTPDARVGVWLMPDNQSRGQIEDFLGKLIPRNDGCWDYAQEATQRARQLGAGVPNKDVCKANIHTWLAWQEKPGLPFGTAITAKYFAVDSPEALAFVEWFKKLFS